MTDHIAAPKILPALPVADLVAVVRAGLAATDGVAEETRRRLADWCDEVEADDWRERDPIVRWARRKGVALGVPGSQPLGTAVADETW